MVGGLDSTKHAITPSSLEVFHPTNLEWQRLRTTGHIPKSIYFSAYATVEQYLYMFGGGFSGQSNSTLWCLDLEKRIWTSVKQVNVPSPRTSGGLVLAGEERLVLFGGKNVNDLHIFSIKTGK